MRGGKQVSQAFGTYFYCSEHHFSLDPSSSSASGVKSSAKGADNPAGGIVSENLPEDIAEAMDCCGLNGLRPRRLRSSLSLRFLMSCVFSKYLRRRTYVIHPQRTTDETQVSLLPPVRPYPSTRAPFLVHVPLG